MKTLILFLVFYLSISWHVSSQERSDLDDWRFRFIWSLFELNFHTAETILAEINVKSNTEVIIGRTQLMWWSSISEGKSPKLLLNYIDSISTTYQVLPPELYFHFNSMRIRVYAAQRNYYQAWREWKTFDSGLQQCIALSDDVTSEFIRGIHHYMKGRFQQKLPLFISDSISYEQNISIGCDILEQCALSSNQIIKLEAHYFLMRIYWEQKGSESRFLRHSNQLVGAFPGNYIFRYHQAKYLHDAKKIKEASMSVQSGFEAIFNASYSNAQKEYGKQLLESINN